MVDGGLYDVYWAPDFTDDVTAAVAYVAEELGSPIAARNLFEGVTELLESKRAMPTAATSSESPSGATRYVASYKNWDVYYVVEERSIKAVGLKHQLQDGPRGTRDLP